MTAVTKTKDQPAPAAFQWDDPFLLTEQLTEDERILMEAARSYAQDNLIPRVLTAYRSSR